MGRQDMFKSTRQIIDEMATTIIEREKAKDEQIEVLKSDLAKIKDEKWKDGELVDMKAKLKEAQEMLCLGFGISKEENAKIAEWETAHIKKMHDDNHYCGAIGGRFDYCFTPTSVGTVGVCECGQCIDKVRKEYYTKRKNGRYDHDLWKKLVEKYDAEFTFMEI